MFTDKLIKALNPKAKPYRKYEGGSDKGFGIQVSGSTKQFFIQYQSPVTNKRRFMKLGAYPDTKLARARKECQSARAMVDSGKDPQIERDEEASEKLQQKVEREKQAAIEKATGTVNQLFKSYIQQLKDDDKRAHIEVNRIYQKDIKSSIGKLKARDVAPEQIKNIIRKIYQRGAPIVANQARAYLMAAFNHGIKLDFDPAANTEALFRIEHNPARDIPVPAKVTPGERNLSAEEIRDLWRQLDNAAMAFSTKTAIRLLFATGGQRVEEVLGMRWGEVDFERKLWELPINRTKNARPHVVPLSDLAISLIKGMQILSSDSQFIFPSIKGKKPMPYQTLSQAVGRFCNPPARADGEQTKGFPKFVPKDIRRTVKSRMGELGLSKEIRDRLHNHALHDVSSKHYDRFDYLEPKKVAVETWSKWLQSTITGANLTNNILPMAEKKA